MAQYVYKENTDSILQIASTNTSHQGVVTLGTSLYGGSIKFSNADNTITNSIYIGNNNSLEFQAINSSSTTLLNFMNDGFKLGAPLWITSSNVYQLELHSTTSGQTSATSRLYSDSESGKFYAQSTDGARKMGIDMPGNNARWYRLWSDNTHGHLIQIENSRIYVDGDLTVTANSLGSSSLGPITATNVQQPIQLKSFWSNGGVLSPSVASPIGSQIGASGTYEIDFNSMILRIEASIWPKPGTGATSTTTQWSNNAWTFCTATQLFTLLGLTNYTIDKTRLSFWHNGTSTTITGGVVIGTARWNNPNNSTVAAEQAHGSYIAYYPADSDTNGPIGMGRIYNLSNPAAIGLWASDLVLADDRRGISMKIVLPFKAK